MGFENRPVRTYVYYKPQIRLGTSTIVINRKSLRHPITKKQCSVKKSCVQRSSKLEGPSSVAPEVKRKNVFIDIVLAEANDPFADTNTEILESALQTYCQNFQSPF